MKQFKSYLNLTLSYFLVIKKNKNAIKFVPFCDKRAKIEALFYNTSDFFPRKREN